MGGADCYLRHTDAEGKQHVSAHRVWSIERFVADQENQAAKLKAEKVANGRIKVERISSEQYAKERGK